MVRKWCGGVLYIGSFRLMISTPIMSTSASEAFGKHGMFGAGRLSRLGLKRQLEAPDEDWVQNCAWGRSEET